MAFPASALIPVVVPALCPSFDELLSEGSVVLLVIWLLLVEFAWTIVVGLGVGPGTSFLAGVVVLMLHAVK